MKKFKSSILMLTVLLIGKLSWAHENHTNNLVEHLSYKQNTLHIHAFFPMAPVVNRDSLLVLEAMDSVTHQPVELKDNVDVVLWMPSMGHGSAPTQVERALDAQGNLLPGVFNIRNVYFIMGGEWEVRITLTDDQGKQETQSFKVIL